MAIRPHARLRRISPSRWGRGLAVVLCVLALAVNLLGAVAYAQAWTGAAISAGLDPNLSICHSQPEAPAPEAPKPPKCPLCTVSAAGLAAPPVQAPTAIGLTATAVAIEAPVPDAPKLPAVVTRPGSRAPPLPA